MKDKRLSQLQAETLLELVKEHKRNDAIDHSECGVSTYLMWDVYKSLIDREWTQEELAVFM